VIPCLLLKGSGFVKTERFKKPKYLGDPRNTIRLFNDKEVDELVVLDVAASREGRAPRVELIREIVDEAFVPVAYGGGISTVEQAHEILSLGVEKLVINAAVVRNPEILGHLAKEFGRQSVVASIDSKKGLLGGHWVYADRGSRKTRWTPQEYAKRVVEAGAGELLVQSVDRDGTMAGYDLELVQSVTESVDVPVIACGGAGSVAHLAEVVHQGGASAAAGGSMFVFKGPHRAVLVSFPEHEALVDAGLRSRPASIDVLSLHRSGHG
jgi:cyclase